MGLSKSNQTSFKKGMIPWNKGKKTPNFYHEKQFKKGNIPANKGISHSKKTRIKMSLAWKNRITDKTKIKMSKERKERYKNGFNPVKGKHWKIKNPLSGEQHHSWKGGITPINIKIRNSIESNLWRNSVFARDGFICQKTKIKGNKLVAHHILNFSSYPELRFAIDNGITLSEKAHIEFHKIYGRKNNSREQLEKFLNN